jgi:hypothetical protein
MYFVVFCTVLKKWFVHNKTHKSIIRSATDLRMQTLNTVRSYSSQAPSQPAFGKLQFDHGHSLRLSVHREPMSLHCLETAQFPQYPVTALSRQLMEQTRYSGGYRMKTKTKLRGLSPRENYTDRATAACRRNLVPNFADKGCHVISVTDPYGRILCFLDRSRYFFFQVARLSGPRSRPTISQKI